MSCAARILAYISVLCCLLCASSYSQSPDPLFGLPPFSTITGSQYDTIDLATSNVLINLPLRNKIGKMPFTSQLSGGGRAFQQPACCGRPLPNWNVEGGNDFGLALGEGLRLYYYEAYTQQCGTQPNDPVYMGFTAIDASGVSHSLQPFITMDEYGCWTTTATLATQDGSGYTAYINTSGSGSPSVLYDKFGNNTSKAGYITDPDKISMSIIPNSAGNYTDTLGTTVLTDTGSGVGPAPQVYSYIDVNGNTQNYTVTYSSLLFATNFGCSGVTDITATSSSPYPTTITTPTLGTYIISYEATPGKSGYITGRIAKITFPMGGYISYAYTGGNNGINCGSQFVPTLTRTVNDGLGNNSVWTYQNTATAWNQGPFNVNVTDPAGNLTVVTFAGSLSGTQTESVSYQGSSGTPLVTTITCYNNNFANCPTTGGGVPISQTDVFTYLNGSSSASLVETKYDTYGDVTLVAKYDIGAATTLPPTKAPSIAPLSATTTVYGTWNGSTCASMSTVNSNIGAYMHAYPCTVTTVNAAGTMVSQKRYTYNAGGHPTQTQSWVSGTTNYLTSSATYNSNGPAATVTDVNGTASTYAYNGTDGCNGLLPTSVTSAGLTTTFEWNCNGGVLTETLDPNSQPTTHTYNDPLWRLTSTTDAAGSTTTYSYPSQTTSESAMNFGTTSTVDKLITTDGLGRPIFSQTRQAQGSSNFDSVQTSYGWTTNTIINTGGAFTTTSLPYVGTAGQAAPPGTAVVTTYADALGRPIAITDGAGEKTVYNYIQNDVFQSIGSSPLPFQRNLQYNGLGQLTSVCEVNSLPGSGACGQTNSVPGFLTQYTYDPLGNLLTVAQNTQPGAAGGQQNRTYRYDGLSRLIFQSNPEESSATTYTYDTDATCGTSRGDQVKRVDANGNTVCNAYDGLHRSTSTTFSGPNATTNRYFVYDAGAVDGQTMANAKGRLAEAYTATSSSGTKITDEGFSYTARGELSKFLELTPHSAGFYSVPLTYWANGLKETVGPFLNEAVVSITPDGEGRASAISGGAIDITYNTASQPTQLQVSCGSGICYPITYTYDPNTLRMTQYSFAGSNGTLSGTLTWNQNGSLGQLVVADPVNSADVQTCNYSADSLARLASVSCNSGATWGQQFSYDAFRNITKTVPSGATGVSWIPGYSTTTNHYSLGGTSYDSNGNVLHDSFNAYTWDAEGKQLSTVYSGGETWSYTYDAFGHMVELAVNGAYTYSYLKLGNFRFSATGQTAEYSETPLPGGSIASQGNGDTGIQIGDWLGTIRGNSDYTGGVVNSTGARAPFGEPYAYAGAAPEAFTGQDGDGQRSSPIYWFPERQYVSTQGRWISPDPAGLGAVDPSNPQSWNRYAYVTNNPLNSTDPLGLQGPPGGGMAQCGPGGSANGCNTPVSYGCPLVFTGCGSNNFPSLANNLAGWDALNINWIWGSEEDDVYALLTVIAANNGNCSITVNCRGIQTDNLGKIGIQHCDAQVTDSSGAVWSLSGGPQPNYMSITALNAWATSPPTEPFTGTTVYQGNSCSAAGCMIQSTQAWNQDIVKPAYSPVFGPNSNTWLKGTATSCGVSLPINAWGSIW